MPSRIAIVIADDHAVLRESLAALLQSQPDFEWWARPPMAKRRCNWCRSTARRCWCWISSCRKATALRCCARWTARADRVASVVLTGSESQNDYVQVVRLGARGLVLKGDDPQKLFAAIRVGCRRRAWPSPTKLPGACWSPWFPISRPCPASMSRLSERERQISYMVARGMRNRDIATDSKISENTVKRHLQSIFSKTGSRDRLELAVLALTDINKAA